MGRVLSFKPKAPEHFGMMITVVMYGELYGGHIVSLPDCRGHVIDDAEASDIYQMHCPDALNVWFADCRIGREVLNG